MLTSSSIPRRGVDPQSTSPASSAILSGSFWYGGEVSNISVGLGGNCSLAQPTQMLTCNLGAIPVGAFGPTVQFDVSALPQEAAPHCLPVFLGGLNGFVNGPEMFARLQID